MKTLIIALNSKYIHTSLAPWYLKAYCGDELGEIKVLEYTINDNLDSILASIYREKADAAAFSCYIWNIIHVHKLAENLKKAAPDTKIIFGGPEVSFDAAQAMNENNYVYYIISGEGEHTFKQLLNALQNNLTNIAEIKGLTYRSSDTAISNGECGFINDLDSIPSPYTNEMLAGIKNRIVYYESSRGCPFDCSYCLSSTFQGVRYFSLDRVKADLRKLIEARVRQVKFVDRTFNANKARAKEIISFILDNAIDGTNFHFEAAADLFDDELLELLAEAPEGLLQFEVGIQTTNERTLERINRKTNIGKVFTNVRKLKALKNSHIHLDLIAGLPLEDYDSFRQSFNEVYNLQPEQLQLGFLKMLKGSKVRAEAPEHDYRFRSYPPYEILSNKYISFDEILELKRVEELVERYYNSGKFDKSLPYIINSRFPTPFDFFKELMQHGERKGFFEKSISSRELYSVLFKYVSEISTSYEFCGMVHDFLKLDYLSSDNSNNLPEGLNRVIIAGFKEKCFELLRDECNIEQFLHGFIGIPAKQIFKQVHFEVFDYDISNVQENNGIQRQKTVILFDYSVKNKVTGLYRYLKVPVGIEESS